MRRSEPEQEPDRTPRWFRASSRCAGAGSVDAPGAWHAAACNQSRRPFSEPGATSVTCGELQRGGVAQGLGLWCRLEPFERVVLDLADALARDVERGADLLQRARAAAGEAVAHLDDLPLAVGQHGQCATHVVAAPAVAWLLQRRPWLAGPAESGEPPPPLLPPPPFPPHPLPPATHDVAHLSHTLSP